MITPTVGRIVWYRPSESERAEKAWQSDNLAAIVVHVHSDTCVNLAVFDETGTLRPRISVELVQGETKPVGSYCEWMPYQKGQAAKTEQAEKQLAGSGT